MSKSMFKAIKPQSNTIFRGDNLEIMKALPDESIDLCYIDPPFFTQKDYKNMWGDRESVLDWDGQKLEGFFDTKDFFEKHVHNGEKGLVAYLSWMRMRILEIHRILRPTGSLYLHLDHHAVHYMKVILDEIFGYKNFRSEIIWKRKNGINSAGAIRSFGSTFDTILFYSKSEKYTFEPQFTKLDEDYVKKHYRHNDNDGKGPYQLAPLIAPSDSPTLKYDFMGYKTPARGWRWTKDRMTQAYKAGKLHLPKDKSQQIRQKQYLNEMKGNPITNIWDDIGMVQKQSAEATGWPTQKPVALLERIIRTSSKEGEIVFDCFAGCGTSMHASHNLKRKWIGIDISPTAVKVNKKRLEKVKAKVTVIDEHDLPVELGTSQGQRKLKKSA